MGEVDDVQHAVDQRQADGDQHIDAAGQQAVQHAGEDDLRIEHDVYVVPTGAREAGSGGDLDSAAAAAQTTEAASTSLRFARGELGVSRQLCAQLNFGFGKTAFTSANSAGAITWMSPLFACITPGRPPSFWPLTNLVGP